MLWTVLILLIFADTSGCQDILMLNFIKRIDLSDFETEILPSSEVNNVHSTTLCSMYCKDICYMFSYDFMTKSCHTYSDVLQANINLNGSKFGQVYFRRRECPEGMYQNGTDCLSCSTGQYQDTIGQSQCKPCPAGEYQDELGQSTCKPCLNTIDWRYGTNDDQSNCIKCWSGFNTYTDGDMANLISTESVSSSSLCGKACDETANCELFTWRSGEQKCYLHSTTSWSWGYVHKREELIGGSINIAADQELCSIRSVLECSTSCTDSCYMFSYDGDKVCRIFSSAPTSPIQMNGTNESTRYYRKRECPEGTYHNQSDCFSCDKGYYQGLQGQDTCQFCPSQHYQDEMGKPSCKPCLNSSTHTYGVSPDRTTCYRCWYGLNTYMEGDMSNLIKSISLPTSARCAQECDSTPGCKMLTWRGGEKRCYLHSVTGWSWGTVKLSVVFANRCRN